MESRDQVASPYKSLPLGKSAYRATESTPARRWHGQSTESVATFEHWIWSDYSTSPCHSATARWWKVTGVQASSRGLQGATEGRVVNRTGRRDVNLSWLCLRAMPRDRPRGTSSTARASVSLGRGSPLIRAKDQSTAWHSSFWRGLAWSYIGVPVSRERDLPPMRVYIRGGERSSSKKVSDKVTANGGNGLHGKKRSSTSLLSSYPKLQHRVVYASVTATANIGYSIENNLTTFPLARLAFFPPPLTALPLNYRSPMDSGEKRRKACWFK